ncbi:hypothetical protein SCUCBS95973_003000 [Sporothrix curviconia]|uniref:Dead deah box DNA helicase n=1 Tax=Sporothrix curviconia TaxID=1260050 RepID=A0ABP0BBT1_9PEZI
MDVIKPKRLSASRNNRAHPRGTPSVVDPISSSTTLVPSTADITDVDGSKTTDSFPTPNTPFTTAADILSLAYSTPGDALVVAPASTEEYHSLLEARDESGRKARIFYFQDQRLLIVTVPTHHHEALHRGINLLVISEIVLMGLRSDWKDTGATTFVSGLLGNTSAGEGDSGGRPKSTRPGGRSWPVLVVEAGWTQSVASLRCKKDFWFRQSDHQVKIVILAKAFPPCPGDAGVDKRILIEHWQEPARLQRPGATETRMHAAASRDSVCLQTINIVWAGPVSYDDAPAAMRQNTDNFNVTRGPLKLDFSSLFLRQPVAGAGEHDLLLEDAELQEYAADVWFN